MKSKNKKCILFICALILLLTSIFTDLKIISSEVYATTEELCENTVENEQTDEPSLINKQEEINENAQEVIEDDELQEENVEDEILLSEDEIMLLANPGASSTVQYHGSVSYGGSKVGHFSIDGKIAFCMFHSKKTPPTGTGVTASIYDNINIAKCLYYGWGGDGQWGGFTSEAMGIVMTSLALDYFYVGNNHKVANPFINFVNSQELPMQKLYFSNPHITGRVVGEQQATDPITLIGDSRYSISFALQPGVQLHNMTKGQIFTDRATLNGGDSFWLLAPRDINPSWTSENIGNSGYKLSSIIWASSNGNYQPLGQYSIDVDPSYYINLSVDWEIVSDKGSLEIVKTDETGALLDGAKVKITSDNGYSNEDVLVSGGKLLITDLEPGQYTVEETEAPEGYQIDKTPFSVNVEVGKKANVTILNGALPEQKVEIGITKTNEDGSAKLSGSIFKIWNDSDYSQSFRTDSNGNISIDGLEVGNYYYQETFAPYGYLLDNTIRTMSLNDDGSGSVSGSATVINREPTGSLTITKEDNITGNAKRIDGRYHHGDASIAGAVYTLYASGRITNRAGTVTYFNSGDAIATFTFNEKGIANVQILKSSSSKLRASGSTLSGIPLGTYTLRETTVPTGYTEDTRTYIYTFSYRDQYTSVITKTGTVYNTVKTEPFDIIKVSTDTNDTAELIEGAEFTVILKKYVEYYGSFEEALKHTDDYAYDEWGILTTDEKGYAISERLAYRYLRCSRDLCSERYYNRS